MHNFSTTLSGILDKLQIPALTLVERQAWPVGSWKTWAKFSRANPTKNVGIIGAVK